MLALRKAKSRLRIFYKAWRWGSIKTKRRIQREQSEEAERIARRKIFTASRLAVRHEHDESKKSKESKAKFFSELCSWSPTRRWQSSEARNSEDGKLKNFQGFALAVQHEHDRLKKSEKGKTKIFSQLRSCCPTWRWRSGEARNSEDGKSKKVSQLHHLLPSMNITDRRSRRRARWKIFQSFALATQHEDDKAAKRETRKMASWKIFYSFRSCCPAKKWWSRESEEGQTEKIFKPKLMCRWWILKIMKRESRSDDEHFNFSSKSGFHFTKADFFVWRNQIGIFKKSMLEIPASVEKVRTFSIKNLEGEIFVKGKPLRPW